MATNPMQKKARNAFLLGVILTMIIVLIAAAAFYFLVYKKGTITTSSNEKIVYAYRLTQDVKFGGDITSAMVEPVTVSEKVAPVGTFNSKVQSGNKWTDQSYIPNKAKVDLKAGTILSSEVTYTEEVGNDVRLAEYNMITLPTTLQIGDTIDIRLKLGNGQDFVVISQKQVKSILGNTVGMNLSESEILMMNSAIVEAYVMKSANLYAIQYIDGSQKEATKTYVPTEAVQNLINVDSNIVTTAKNELTSKFINGVRANIESEKQNYADAEKENIEAGFTTQIENAKKAREAYLTGVTTY
jgi:hypothetical protein